MNIPSDWVSNTNPALANGAATTLYIPFDSVFSTGNVFMGGLAGDVIFRVFLAGGTTKVLDSGAAVPSLQNLSLVMRTTEIPMSRYNAMRQKHLSEVHDHSFLVSVPQSISQTFNSSTKYTQVLSGITHLISHLFITLRSNVSTGLGQRTYTSTVDSFNLLDESGNTLTGLSVIPRTYNLLVQYPDYFPSTLTHNATVLTFSHSKHCTQAAKSGSNFGPFSYNGKQQLELTTSSTHTNGSYTLEVLGMAYRLMRINKGMVEVFN